MPSLPRRRRLINDDSNPNQAPPHHRRRTNENEPDIRSLCKSMSTRRNYNGATSRRWSPRVSDADDAVPVAVFASGQGSVGVTPHSGDRENVNIFEMLPDSVLSKCFFDGYLNTVSVMKSLSCVSKRTQAVARETVKMLDLSRYLNLGVGDIETVAFRFPNLSYIDLNYCTQISGSHLMKLVPLAKTLRVLRLRGSCITDENIEAFFAAANQLSVGNAASMLEELDLSATTKGGSIRIGDVSVKKISSACPNLRTLLLGWCSRVSDDSIDSLRKLQNLRQLDVSLSSISNAACLSLSKMPWLLELDISATRVQDEGVRTLVSGKLDPPSPLHSTVLEEDYRILQQQNIHRCELETLNLRFIKGISVGTLGLMAHHAHRLKTLDLSHCGDVIYEIAGAKKLIREMKQNGTVILRGPDPLRY